MCVILIRRMFPSVRVKVRNLEPCQQYYIAMDVMPVDSKRYRCESSQSLSPLLSPADLPACPLLRYVYHSSQWMVAGNTDHSCISPRLYVHPDSPCTGETWMRQVISFDRVKLTNNEMDDKGHVGDHKVLLISASKLRICNSWRKVLVWLRSWKRLWLFWNSSKRLWAVMMI